MLVWHLDGQLMPSASQSPANGGSNGPTMTQTGTYWKQIRAIWHSTELWILNLVIGMTSCHQPLNAAHALPALPPSQPLQPLKSFCPLVIRWPPVIRWPQQTPNALLLAPHRSKFGRKDAIQRNIWCWITGYNTGEILINSPNKWLLITIINQYFSTRIHIIDNRSLNSIYIYLKKKH